MNHSHATGQQPRAEELVSWTCGERIRFLWYRLCLTVQEMACLSVADWPGADMTTDEIECIEEGGTEPPLPCCGA